MMESERWRRLLLDVPAGVTLPRPVDVVEISSSQRLATITTNNYQPALHMAFESIGARVQEVQRMSLEEIFVASVMRSREEVAAARRSQHELVRILGVGAQAGLSLVESSHLQQVTEAAVGMVAWGELGDTQHQCRYRIAADVGSERTQGK